MRERSMGKSASRRAGVGRVRRATFSASYEMKEVQLPMSPQTQAPGHIEVTETLVRLYVFLTQYLDRCLDEAARKSYPDEELHAHLGNDGGHSRCESRGQGQSREGMSRRAGSRSSDLEGRP